MLTSEQIKQERLKYGFDTPVSPLSKEERKKRLSDIVAQTKQPQKKNVVLDNTSSDEKGFFQKTGPSYKASLGGTETLAPNIAKTFGNIPSSARDLTRSLISPVNPFDTESPLNIGANIVKSGQALTDIQNAGGGLKDVASGFASLPGKAYDLWYGLGEKIYNSLEKNVLEQGSVTEGLKAQAVNTTTDIAKIGIEDPLFIPSLMYGGSGKGDLIARTSQTVTKPISKVVSKTVQKTEPLIASQKAKAVDNLEQTYTDIMSGTTPGKKKIGKIELKTEMMNKAGTEGRTPMRTLAEDGIIPNRKGAKIDTFDQATQYRETIKPLQTVNRKALEEAGLSSVGRNLDDLEEKAIKYVNSQKNLDSGIADKMEKEIRNEFAILKKNNPSGIIPLSRVDDIKSARWNNVFENKGLIEVDKLKKNTDYAIAKALQKDIEKVSASVGNKEVAQLNREIGDRLGAAKFLQELDGKTIKGGRLLKYITTGIGASMGNTFTGKIVGALGGNLVGELIIANTIANPVKRLLLRNLKAADPDSYVKTIEWLSNQKSIRENLLRLPAPKKGNLNPLNIQQPTINLPENIRNSTLGLDETKNIKISRFGNQDNVDFVTTAKNLNEANQGIAKPYSSLENRQSVFQSKSPINQSTNAAANNVANTAIISPLAKKIISPRSGTLADKILNPENRAISKISRNTSNVKTEPLKYFKKETPKVEVLPKISRVRQEELLGQIQDNEVALSEQLSKNPATQEQLGNIMTELDISEAGKRIPVKNDYGQIEWMGQSSTFPQWIPEHLRDKKLFNKVMEGLSDIDNIKYPNANKVRQRELYDIIFNELDSRLGTNTNPIREKILKNYDTIYEGETTTGYNSGSRGSQSSTGSGISTTGGNGSPFTTSMSETSQTGIIGGSKLSMIQVRAIDKKIATDFIDSIRIKSVDGKKLTAVQKLNLEIEARLLAPKYKINPELPPNKLADAFDDYFMGKKRVLINKTLPKSNPLIQEAKKYKSAEEFVKAQGETLYHGTPAKFETKDFKGGYLTADKKYADVYQSKSASSISYGSEGVKNKASGEPRTLEFVLPKNAKLFDNTKLADRKLLNDYWGKSSMSREYSPTKTGQLDWTEGENLAEYLREKGYKFDGIKLDEAGGFDPISGMEVKRHPSVLILSPDILKTKSQLTDIFNRAHKLKP